MVNPKIDLWPRWALERKCFSEAKVTDQKTHKQVSWPYMSSVLYVAPLFLKLRLYKRVDYYIKQPLVLKNR